MGFAERGARTRWAEKGQVNVNDGGTGDRQFHSIFNRNQFVNRLETFFFWFFGESYG